MLKNQMRSEIAEIRKIELNTIKHHEKSRQSDEIRFRTFAIPKIGLHQTENQKKFGKEMNSG